MFAETRERKKTALLAFHKMYMSPLLAACAKNDYVSYENHESYYNLRVSYNFPLPSLLKQERILSLLYDPFHTISTAYRTYFWFQNDQSHTYSKIHLMFPQYFDHSILGLSYQLGNHHLTKRWPRV